VNGTEEYRVPVHRLSKKEIEWLARNRCKTHRHSYLEHYSCYFKDYPERQERLAFFDIETSDLKADVGFMLTYCLKVAGKDEILSGVVDAREIEAATLTKSGAEDLSVVTQCVQDIGRFDKLVTFYGKRFDLSFLRTRAMTLGIPFPDYGAIAHIDLYDTVKRKFRLRSNRLEHACQILLGDSRKTRFDPLFWRCAARGDQKSLDMILEHNKFDVLDLERLYNKVIQFSRKSDTSI